jgi:hypothetical protein
MDTCYLLLALNVIESFAEGSESFPDVAGCPGQATSAYCRNRPGDMTGRKSSAQQKERPARPVNIPYLIIYANYIIRRESKHFFLSYTILQDFFYQDSTIQGFRKFSA